MPNETQQPFQDGKQRSTDDQKLVAEVLGTTEAAEMEELLGQTEPQEIEPSAAELDLSAVEQTTAVEAEKSEAEKRHEEYCAWAEANGMDEEWVRDTFIFDLDGVVKTKNHLRILNTGLSELPPGIKEVTGDLRLSGNQFTGVEDFPDKVKGDITLNNNQIVSLRGFTEHVGDSLFLNVNQINSLEGLPNYIGRHLELQRNNITSLKGLPDEIKGDLDLGNNPLNSLEGLSRKIGIDLYLRGIPATIIPAGLDIAGVIYLNEDQTELAADAEAKGYTVSFRAEKY